MTRLYLEGVPMATLHEGEWSSEEPGLVRVLNSIREPDGLTPYEPDPEAARGAQAAAKLGAGWTVRTADPPLFDPNVIY